MSEYENEGGGDGGWVEENFEDPGTLNDEPPMSADEHAQAAVPSGVDYRDPANKGVKVADVVVEQQAQQEAWDRGELPDGYWRDASGQVWDADSWNEASAALEQETQQQQAGWADEDRRAFLEIRDELSRMHPAELQQLQAWSQQFEQAQAEQQRQAPLLDRLEAIAQQGAETQQAEQHADLVEQGAHEGLQMLMSLGVADDALESVFNFAEETVAEMVRAGWPESRDTAMHALALAALDHQGVEFRTNRGGEVVPHPKQWTEADTARRGGIGAARGSVTEQFMREGRFQ